MPETLLIILFGTLIGIILGLLGGGGSIIAVPILVYILGQDGHAAITTSLAVVGISSLLGSVIYALKGNVRFKDGILFGLASMTAAIPGAWFSHLISENRILFLFGLLMVLVGLKMLLRKFQQIHIKTGLSHKKYRNDTLKMLIIGFVVGIFIGFFGVGGGFLILPALVFFGHFQIHKAVGTSLLIIAMASASGFVSHVSFSMSNLDAMIIGIFSMGSLLGIFAGTSIANNIDGTKLTKAFASFVIIMGVFLVFKNTNLLNMF